MDAFMNKSETLFSKDCILFKHSFIAINLPIQIRWIRWII